ncbi:YcfL family protein [Gallibacterium trehalosifermentans]|uniref:YcfL family protein n=1 Tax=Gallibacterium trehalosifermentans TaxID=516935 RepID=A0ABV6H2W6_9PAST
MRQFIVLSCLLLGLTACSSKMVSPLSQSSPIVNIEAAIADKLAITSAADQVTLKNKTNQSINLTYLLTWYDKNGVTQRANWQQEERWQKLMVIANQQVLIKLTKPTAASHNYRIYLKAN